MEITDLMAWKKLFCKDTEDWGSVIKASFVETNLYYTLLSFHLFFHLACVQQAKQMRLSWNWRKSSPLGAGPALQGQAQKGVCWEPLWGWPPVCWLLPASLPLDCAGCCSPWPLPATPSPSISPPASVSARARQSLEDAIFNGKVLLSPWAWGHPGALGNGDFSGHWPSLAAVLWWPSHICLHSNACLQSQTCVPRYEEGRYGCPTVTPVDGGDDTAGWWCHHGDRWWRAKAAEASILHSLGTRGLDSEALVEVLQPLHSRHTSLLLHSTLRPLWARAAGGPEAAVLPPRQRGQQACGQHQFQHLQLH